jgi:hypothetical protein
VPSESVQPMKGSGRAQDILEAMRLGLREWVAWEARRIPVHKQVSAMRRGFVTRSIRPGPLSVASGRKLRQELGG